MSAKDDSASPMTWDEKCQIVQSFIDCQDVKTVRHRKSIGWFGRVKEFFMGDEFYEDQLTDYEKFMDDLQMFAVENINDTKSYSDKIIGF